MKTKSECSRPVLWLPSALTAPGRGPSERHMHATHFRDDVGLDTHRLLIKSAPAVSLSPPRQLQTQLSLLINMAALQNPAANTELFKIQYNFPSSPPIMLRAPNDAKDAQLTCKTE